MKRFKIESQNKSYGAIGEHAEKAGEDEDVGVFSRSCDGFQAEFLRHPVGSARDEVLNGHAKIGGENRRRI